MPPRRNGCQPPSLLEPQSSSLNRGCSPSLSYDCPGCAARPPRPQCQNEVRPRCSTDAVGASISNRSWGVGSGSLGSAVLRQPLGIQCQLCLRPGVGGAPPTLGVTMSPWGRRCSASPWGSNVNSPDSSSPPCVFLLCRCGWAVWRPRVGTLPWSPLRISAWQCGWWRGPLGCPPCSPCSTLP